jgi:molybdopterin synthase catalytic subunit
MIVRVQREPFDPGAEVAAHRPRGAGVGAAVHFVGSVRDLSAGDGVTALELEHYPGMTERELERVAAAAMDGWSLLDILVVHRFGRMEPGEGIVLVATWSAHRDAAFEACRYTIDTLKTSAPFWKRETRPDGSREWVAPHAGEGEPPA